MLRHDVVEACSQGRFHVYAIERIEQALELFMETPAGTASAEPPADSIIAIARKRAHAYWKSARSKPDTA